MPQTKQAAKALRQDIKKFAKNKLIRSSLKTMIKKTRKAIDTNGKSDELLKQTIQSLDKAAQKGLIKKNTAARRKSRLMKRLAAKTK